MKKVKVVISLVVAVILIASCVFLFNYEPPDDRILNELIELFESYESDIYFKPLEEDDHLGEIDGVKFGIDNDSNICVYEFSTVYEAKKAFKESNDSLFINGKFLMRGSTPSAAYIFIKEFNDYEGIKSRL